MPQLLNPSGTPSLQKGCLPNGLPSSRRSRWSFRCSRRCSPRINRPRHRHPPRGNPWWDLRWRCRCTFLTPSRPNTHSTSNPSTSSATSRPTSIQGHSIVPLLRRYYRSPTAEHRWQIPAWPMIQIPAQNNSKLALVPRVAPPPPEYALMAAAQMHSEGRLIKPGTMPKGVSAALPQTQTTVK